MRAVTVTLNPAIDQTLSIPGFAMGRVNRVTESRSDAGGKGVNVASVLSSLGISTVATGFLGTDNAGLFETFFAARGIADRFVRLPGATRVGIKVVDGRKQETTDINFPGLGPGPRDLEELFRGIAALAAPGLWFVLSGSVPPGLSDGVYAELIDSIHRKGAAVVLDTSGRALREALASAPEVVKPNVDELSELVGRALDSSTAVRAAALSLLDRGVHRVVVSMGGAGALFVERDRALIARPPKVAVESTVGAGDSMVGGIVYGLLNDLPLEDLAATATACGAYAVTRVGSGIESLAELEKLKERVEIEPFN